MWVNMSSGAGDNAGAKYRHIPQVAASQFERTTTVDSAEVKTLAPKLSRAAIKLGVGRLNGAQSMSANDGATAPCEMAKAMQKAQIQRNREYERNQFQHPSIRQVSADSDERQFYLARHTFETHFRTKAEDYGDDGTTKRPSAFRTRTTSDPPGTTLHLERQDSHSNSEVARVDWTQSDEDKRQVHNPGQSSLRKAESKWALRGRLGPFQKSKDALSSPPETVDSAAEESLKSPKSLK